MNSGSSGHGRSCIVIKTAIKQSEKITDQTV